MARRAAPLALLGWLGWLAACGFESPRGSPDGAPTPSEAGPPDAAPDPTFDPAAECPSTYTVSLPSTASTSRYRVITALAQFWPHNTTCNADRPGVTHAATLGTMQELTELKTGLDAASTLERYYLGGIQDPQATAPNQGWIWFDGTSLLQTAWHTPEEEPDDANSGTERHGQQLVILDRRLTYLHDAAGVSSYGIVCECDGTPVTAMAQDFVDRDPVNPN
jgi:hypothetical protein